MTMARTKPHSPAAAQRAALIRGEAVADDAPPRPALGEFIRYAGRQGTRLIRLTAIEQIICNSGQLNGPWLIRVGSQELPVDEELARQLTERLTGWPSAEVFP